MAVRRVKLVVMAALFAGAATYSIASRAAPALDYEFFKARVQPVFLQKRDGHTRCYVCHAESNNAFRLERLSPCASTWSEEQSRYLAWIHDLRQTAILLAVLGLLATRLRSANSALPLAATAIEYSAPSSGLLTRSMTSISSAEVLNEPPFSRTSFTPVCRAASAARASRSTMRAVARRRSSRPMSKPKTRTYAAPSD